MSDTPTNEHRLKNLNQLIFHVVLHEEILTTPAATIHSTMMAESLMEAILNEIQADIEYRSSR